jgi:hypothetical protein
MKYDFIKTVDAIFKTKSEYKNIPDEDKEYNFFIINRKFASKYIKQAKFLNSKNIDKVMAMDLWFLFFKNQNVIPGWYWQSKSNKKEEKVKVKKISNSDLKMILDNNENLTQNDLEFLIKYYPTDVQNEIKKLNKFE